MQMIKHNFFHLFVHLLLLPEDHITFPLDRMCLQLRILEDIAYNVHGLIDILPEALRIVHRLLSRGIGIQMRAHILDFKFKITLGTSICALECHVFKKVGSAIRGVGFGTGTSIDPHTDRRSLGVRM